MGEADQATVQFLRGDDTHAPVLLIGGSPAAAAPATVRRAACGCRAVVAIDRGLDAALALDVAVGVASLAAGALVFWLSTRRARLTTDG